MPENSVFKLAFESLVIDGSFCTGSAFGQIWANCYGQLRKLFIIILLILGESGSGASEKNLFKAQFKLLEESNHWGRKFLNSMHDLHIFLQLKERDAYFC